MDHMDVNHDAAIAARDISGLATYHQLEVAKTRAV